MTKLMPVRNWVKIKIVTNKKVGNIEIVSESRERMEAFIEAIGDVAQKEYPNIKIGQRVELIGKPMLNIFKENDNEYALIDAGLINGVYVD